MINILYYKYKIITIKNVSIRPKFSQMSKFCKFFRQYFIKRFSSKIRRILLKTRRISNGARLSAQISLFNFVTLRQFCTGAGQLDAAGFQHIRPIGNPQRHFRILLNKQNGRAAGV